MILNIKKVYTKPQPTQYGEKIKVGLIAEEYGENVWVNSLMQECNIKSGDIIEADITYHEKYGYEFTYKGKFEKIKKARSKEDDIRFMNAINNACLLAAHQIINYGEIEEAIKWLYSLEAPEKYEVQRKN